MRLETALANRLKAEADIVALLPGGIYDQPIVPPEVEDDGVPGDNEYIFQATPLAYFSEAEIEAQDGAAGQLKRCISIIVQPRSPGRTNWAEAAADLVDVFFYGPDHMADLAALEEAQAKVKAVFTSCFLHPSGSGCVVNPTPEGVPYKTVPEAVWTIGGIDRYIATWFP